VAAAAGSAADLALAREIFLILFVHLLLALLLLLHLGLCNGGLVRH
jgi:hypothetical protein